MPEAIILQFPGVPRPSVKAERPQLKGQRKSLKPSQLFAAEDKNDRAILAEHNPQALDLTPEDDPEIIAARQELQAAQAQLEGLMQKKARLRLIGDISTLDASKVEEMCEAEPWKRGELTEISKDKFGFVPERFEAAAQMQPEGSPLRDGFMEARDRARVIYDAQLKAAVERATARIQHKVGNGTRLQLRGAFEHTSNIMWTAYKAMEKENNPVFKYQAARLLKATLLVGDTYMRRHEGERKETKGPGYQKISFGPLVANG